MTAAGCLSHRMCTPCQIRHKTNGWAIDLQEFVTNPSEKKPRRCHYCGEVTFSQMKSFRRPVELTGHECAAYHQEEEQ